MILRSLRISGTSPTPCFLGRWTCVGRTGLSPGQVACHRLVDQHLRTSVMSCTLRSRARSMAAVTHLKQGVARHI